MNTPLESSDTQQNSGVPRHVAIVMDGNGRWAKKRFLPRMAGHRAGVKHIHSVVDAAAYAGVKELTLFAFSRENWQRPQNEISSLMTLFSEMLSKNVTKLHEENVCLQFIGDRTRLTSELLTQMSMAEKHTADNAGIFLNIAIDYSGRWAMFEEMRQFLTQNQDSNHLTASYENYERWSKGHTLSDVDLMIRTSGEYRISNFMLWQLAYSELYFTDCFWPDFSKKNFLEALEIYKFRERRFGTVTKMD